MHCRHRTAVGRLSRTGTGSAGCSLGSVWGLDKGSPPCRSLGWLLGSAPCGFHRWRGDYGGKKQLWFPSNYVEEMVSPASLEPEREVSTEPWWWDTPATHTVRVPVHARPPSSVVHSHPLWGRGFQDTYCVCVVLCMLVRCVVVCTQTARPTHAYSR